MRHGSSGLRLVVLVLTLAARGQAQQKPKELPDAPIAKPDHPQQKHENAFHSTIEILGRRSVFFPDLATSRGPLSRKQKFELFAGESVAPSRFLSSAAGAGYGQARDSLTGYGQGMGGYGKRFGASMATAASTNFFSTFLLPSMLGHDPRHFVALHGSPGRRVGYALSRIVVTRTDRGTEAPNWAGMAGPLLAESLANSYLPASEQTTGRTFQRYGWRIGFTAASSMLKEYWPTIFKSLRIAKIAPGLNPNGAKTAEPKPIR